MLPLADCFSRVTIAPHSGRFHTSTSPPTRCFQALTPLLGRARRAVKAAEAVGHGCSKLEGVIIEAHGIEPGTVFRILGTAKGLHWGPWISHISSSNRKLLGSANPKMVKAAYGAA